MGPQDNPEAYLELSESSDEVSSWPHDVRTVKIHPTALRRSSARSSAAAGPEPLGTREPQKGNPVSGKSALQVSGAQGERPALRVGSTANGLLAMTPII